MFTPQPPEKGILHKHLVEVLWQDERTTESCVTWYGRGTRYEYRLTRFGREFPFLKADAVGNLLVLIPNDLEHFTAYTLDLEDDIESVQATLGAEIRDAWAVYAPGFQQEESENDCIDRHFRGFTVVIDTFPSVQDFTEKTRAALIDCVRDFLTMSLDKRIVLFIDLEYRLFRLVERKLSEPDICRLFESVDDFLQTAASIMNRRKSRAGRSFENHVGHILTDAGIPFDVRSRAIPGEPDVIIPGVAQYLDTSWPVEKLFALALKTTCKDRWRQVLREAPRLEDRHLFTLQRGISPNQLAEMAEARVTLVVPKPYHKEYPKGFPGRILTVDQFADDVRERLGL